MTDTPEVDATAIKPVVNRYSFWTNLFTGIVGVVYLLPQITEAIAPIISPQTAVALGVASKLFLLTRQGMGLDKEVKKSATVLD